MFSIRKTIPSQVKVNPGSNNFYTLGSFILILAVVFFATYSLVFAHVGIPAAPITSCGSIDSTEFRTHVTNQIDSRLTGLASSTSLNLFTTIGDSETTLGATTTPWVRNTNVWSNQDADIDWTGISPWNQPNDGYSSHYQKGGTLISPRHVILANHWYMPNGSRLAFVTNTNEIVYRTLSDSMQVGSTDLRIGILDSDVPDSITYYPIIGSSTLAAVLGGYKGDSRDIPIVITGQNKTVGIQKYVDSINNLASFTPYTTGKKAEFAQTVQNGDSGNPGFIVVDGKPTLFLYLYFMTAGPLLGNYISEINSVMSALGGGYQVTEYNPTCFTEYPQNARPQIVYTSGTLSLFNPVQSTSTNIAVFTGSDIDADQTLSFSIISATSSATSTPLNVTDIFSISTTTTTMTVRQKGSIDPSLYGSTVTIIAQVRDNISGNEGFATTSKNLTVAQISTTTNYIAMSPIGETLQLIGRPVGIQFDSAGNLVMAGAFSSVFNNSLVRLGPIKVTPAAALETVFDANAGYGFSFSTTTDSHTSPYTLEKDDAGNFIIGTQGLSTGLITAYNRVPILNPQRIAKISSTGILDTAFMANMGTGFGSGQVYDIESDQNNDLYVWGNFTTFNGSSTSKLVKLNSNGTINVAFHTNYSSTTVGGTLTTGTIDYDRTSGNLYASGNFLSITTPNGSVYNSARIMKVSQDGTVDTSFATNAGTGFNAPPTDLVVRPDGKVIVVGLFTSYNGATTTRIALLNADGTLNTQFNANAGAGIVGTLTASNVSVVVQSDNKVIIGGNITSYNGKTVSQLIRLNADGTIDDDFNAAVGTGLGASTGVGKLRFRDDGALAVGCNCTAFNGTNLSWTSGTVLLLTTKTPATPVLNFVNNAVFSAGATTTLSTSSVQFSGTGSSTATVQIYRNGTLFATTTVGATGIWSLDAILPVGDSSISYSQSLQVLNTATSTVSSAAVFTVDVTPPAVPVIMSHNSGDDMALSNNTISGMCENGTIISVSNSNITSNGTTTCASNVFSLSVTWDLPAANTTQSLAVVASDAVGNTATSTVSVDVFGVPTPPTSLVLVSDTSVTTPRVSMSCTNGSTVSLYKSSTLLGTAICSVSSATITSLSALSLGSHSLVAIQNNVGGTSTASAVLTFTLTAPLVVAGGGGSTGSSFGGGAVSTSAPITSVYHGFDADLRLGMQSVDVKTLQQFLNSIGFIVASTGPGSKGKETSYFGVATAAALKRFEKSQNLPQTGQLYSVTRNALNAYTKTVSISASTTDRYIFTKDLSLGVRDFEVFKLQQFLNQKGFLVASTGLGSKGNETTYFGLATRNALKIFQKASKVSPINGFFGPVTRGRVNEMQ